MLMHRPKDLSDSCNLLMSLKSCKHFDSVKQEFYTEILEASKCEDQKAPWNLDVGLSENRVPQIS